MSIRYATIEGIYGTYPPIPILTLRIMQYAVCDYSIENDWQYCYYNILRCRRRFFSIRANHKELKEEASMVSSWRRIHQHQQDH